MKDGSTYLNEDVVKNLNQDNVSRIRYRFIFFIVVVSLVGIYTKSAPPLPLAKS